MLCSCSVSIRVSAPEYRRKFAHAKLPSARLLAILEWGQNYSRKELNMRIRMIPFRIPESCLS